MDGPNVYTYVVQNPWTNFDPLGLAVGVGYKTVDAAAVAAGVHMSQQANFDSVEYGANIYRGSDGAYYHSEAYTDGEAQSVSRQTNDSTVAVTHSHPYYADKENAVNPDTGKPYENVNRAQFSEGGPEGGDKQNADKAGYPTYVTTDVNRKAPDDRKPGETPDLAHKKYDPTAKDPNADGPHKGTESTYSPHSGEYEKGGNERHDGSYGSGSNEHRVTTSMRPENLGERKSTPVESARQSGQNNNTGSSANKPKPPVKKKTDKN